MYYTSNATNGNHSIAFENVENCDEHVEVCMRGCKLMRARSNEQVSARFKTPYILYRLCSGTWNIECYAFFFFFLLLLHPLLFLSWYLRLVILALWFCLHSINICLINAIVLRVSKYHIVYILRQIHCDYTSTYSSLEIFFVLKRKKNVFQLNC